MKRSRYRIEVVDERAWPASRRAAADDACRHELDAIAGDAAHAAGAILAAAEDIEAKVRVLRAGASPQALEGLDFILGRVTALYEASAFHDIAAQRVAKLVGLLTVDEDCEPAVDVPPATPDAPRSLVNGPRTHDAEGHISQADIDRMFA